MPITPSSSHTSNALTLHRPNPQNPIERQDQGILHEMATNPNFRVLPHTYSKRHEAAKSWMQGAVDEGPAALAQCISSQMGYWRHELRLTYGEDAAISRSIGSLMTDEMVECLIDPDSAPQAITALSKPFLDALLPELDEETRAERHASIEGLVARIAVGDGVSAMPEVFFELNEILMESIARRMNRLNEEHSARFENFLTGFEKCQFATRFSGPGDQMRVVRDYLNRSGYLYAEKPKGAWALSRDLIYGAFKGEIGVGDVPETLELDLGKLDHFQSRLSYMTSQKAKTVLQAGFKKEGVPKRLDQIVVGLDMPICKLIHSRIQSLILAGVERGGLDEGKIERWGLSGIQADLEDIRLQMFHILKHHHSVHGKFYHEYLRNRHESLGFGAIIDQAEFLKAPIAGMKVRSGF